MELILVITLVLGSFLIASVLNHLINKTDVNFFKNEKDAIDLETLESVTKDEAPEVQD